MIKAGHEAGRGASAQGCVAYILRSYPRLSQTFVLNEILALQELGFRLEIFALANPREPMVQRGVAAVSAATHYLDSRRGAKEAFLEHVRAALASPRRYVATAAYVLRRPDFDAGYSTVSRFRCFDAAVHLASRMREKDEAIAIRHVHSHFAHDPTLIAHLLNRLTGIRFSFTAHARDLYQIPTRALRERIEAASAVVTCCRANLAYLQQTARPADRGKLRLIHHGVDLATFRPSRRSIDRDSPLILAVGRLVEKKGFDDLIAACALLKRAGHAFSCEIHGDGPLLDDLVELSARLGVADRVKVLGARPQHELAPAFQAADVFALTPVVAGDGDRDGIPNVLVEAMACGLPVVSTPVGGIPELVIHGETGLLAKPHDPDSIAAELKRLLVDTDRRVWIGARARRAVTDQFDTWTNARALAEVLESGALVR